MDGPRRGPRAASSPIFSARVSPLAFGVPHWANSTLGGPTSALGGWRMWAGVESVLPGPPAVLAAIVLALLLGALVGRAHAAEPTEPSSAWERVAGRAKNILGGDTPPSSQAANPPATRPSTTRPPGVRSQSPKSPATQAQSSHARSKPPGKYPASRATYNEPLMKSPLDAPRPTGGATSKSKAKPDRKTPRTVSEYMAQERP